MQCPSRNALEDALQDTVATLEATKGSFKSKELGALRRRWEEVLASSLQNRPV